MSSTSNTSLKMKLQATKTKMKFAEQEAAILKRKADADRLAAEADLSVLQLQREEEMLKAELQSLDDGGTLSDKSDNHNRTMEYVMEQNSMSASERPDFNVKWPSIHDPVVHTFLNTGDTPIRGEQFTPRPEFNSRAEQYSTPRVELNSRAETFTPFNRPEFIQHTEPVIDSASNYEPMPIGSYSACPATNAAQPLNSGGSAAQIQLCHMMTQLMTRKDIVLTRLIRYNDSPMQYLSWQRTFKDVMRELSVTPAEEIDLLIKWLGPDSTRQAESIKAASTDSVSGLRKIWERLDTRYGSPELIEECLKQKLKDFPTITTSPRDYKRLFELHDILCEIQYVKNDSRYGNLFAYYDSSAGVNLAVAKLPHNIQERWSSEANKYKKNHNKQYPTFAFFVGFILEQATWRNDPSFQFNNSTPSNQPHVAKVAPSASFDRVNVRKTDIDERELCIIHGTNHSLNRCRTFRWKSLEERMELLKKHKLCFRCCSLLKHMRSKCKEKVQCYLCKSNDHPTALHPLPANETGPKLTVTPSPKLPTPSLKEVQIHEGEKITSNCTNICNTDEGTSKSCAKIVMVNVYPKSKPELARKVYALVDDQSNVSLASVKFFDKCKESHERINYILSSCAGKSSVVGRKACNYVVEALDRSHAFNIPTLIECEELPNNRDEIPSPEVAMYHPHLNALESHIPPIDSRVEIELLIGRDIIAAHHVLDDCLPDPGEGSDRLPFGLKLPLGWVIIGYVCIGKVHEINTVNVNKTAIHVNGRSRASNFESCPNNFRIKQDPIFDKTSEDEKRGNSIEDNLFLDLMAKKMTLDEDGHWVSPLPFCDPRMVLPNNRNQALQRVKSLDRSLEKDPVKKQNVLDFMQKMIDKGHAEVAPTNIVETECWYLPFFGIYHPKKPGNVRVVFDSSTKHNGISLNDVLMKGPDLTNSLLGVLMCFRKEAVALTADVEQMFYNFKVQDSHRDFLRFIWHKDNDMSLPLIDFRMTVHVFGNKPSPAVATYALRKSVEQADDDVQDFVNHGFYVDDGLTSCCDDQSAVDLMKRSQTALQAGGKLRLHKIVSNSKVVLQSFSNDDLSKDLKNLDLSAADTLPMQRSLGLSWDISADEFVFQTSVNHKSFTRRGALSTINGIFDPIGFASPVTMYGKLLLREMMTTSGPINWDEPLPETLRAPWEHWVQSLVDLHQLQVSRPYSRTISFKEATRREVHIFCDASKDAIASVAYLKLFDINDKSDVSFLIAKAKVAPSHGHTIPRLELCAGVLAVEISEIIREQLGLETHMFYTDSQIVLGYISNVTRRFYVYVSNRVSRIRASSSPSQWHFVPTLDNPADIATRRISACDLANSMFIQGPKFLHEDSPLQAEDYSLLDPEQDKEVRPVVVSAKTTVQDNLDLTRRMSRFSTWNSLVRAIWLLKKVARKVHNEEPPTRNEVETLIVRSVQQDSFESDIQAIKSGQNWPKRSNIAPLSPFLDPEGIVRVGGRLSKARNIGNYRNPIIVPKNHHLAILLVRHYHDIKSHQGRHITEGTLRSAGYWVVGSKQLVVTLIRQCVTCGKLRGKFAVQRMADLPEDRLHPGPPFTFIGTDVFGPWSVMHRKTRGGSANQKRWGLLFTCLVSRAIHIELIEELSTSAFINAFRRLIALRGPVKLIRSDRGTNFVGAIKELGIDAEFAEEGPVANELAKHDVQWKFNPPHASHFGGVWERMIGVCRRILDGMLLNERNKLTHEVLSTLMAEVCAVVNSRPLVSVSSDPEHPEVLSPSLLLTQKDVVGDLKFPQFGPKDMMRSQWKLVQGLADEFWSRWRDEYLHTLQPRRKWGDNTKNFKTGDVVLLRDKECHRSQWPMGIIQRVFPSGDEKVRKVEIRVVKDNKNTTYVRPVVEIIPLVEID